MRRAAFASAVMLGALASLAVAQPELPSDPGYPPGQRPHPKPQHPAPEQGTETRQQRRARERSERKGKHNG